MTAEELRRVALSFAGTSEAAHKNREGCDPRSYTNAPPQLEPAPAVQPKQ